MKARLQRLAAYASGALALVIVAAAAGSAITYAAMHGAETGDPKTAATNIRRLLAAGRMVIDVLCRPTGTLFLFSTGEQYYAPGLRVGQDGLRTELLAEIANEAGLGDLVELLDFYTAMPANFVGHLPDLRPCADLQAAPRSSPSTGK